MVITSTKNNEIIDFSKLTNKLDFDYQLNFFKEEKKKYEIFKKNKDFLEHFVKKEYTINIYIDSENEIFFENSNTRLMHIYTTKTYSKKSNNIVSKYFKSEISEDEFLTRFKDDINKRIFKKENDIKTQFLSDDYSSLFYNHQYLLNILSDIELINLINDDKLKNLYTYGYENFNDAVFEKLKFKLGFLTYYKFVEPNTKNIKNNVDIPMYDQYISRLINRYQKFDYILNKEELELFDIQKKYVLNQCIDINKYFEENDIKLESDFIYNKSFYYKFITPFILLGLFSNLFTDEELYQLRNILKVVMKLHRAELNLFEKLYAHTNFKLDERVIEYYASNYKFVSKSLIDKTIFLQTSILINVYADNKASYLLTFADILSNNGVIKYSNSDSSRDGFYFYAQYETRKNDLIGYANILSESNDISTSLFLNKVEENFINKIQ